MSLWVWAIAPVIGLLLGLFGAGGGMLTVPLLVYGIGLPLKQAIASSLWIVAGVSVVAALHQRAWRVVQPALLVFFSIGGIVGSIGGARLGAWIDPALQQALFGILLLVVAVWTWRTRLHEAPPPMGTCHCLAALVVGFAMGLLRLGIDTPVKVLDDFSYAEGSFFWIMSNTFFQYYSLVIFLVCSAVILVVSYATSAPVYDKIQGLTYATLTDEDRRQSRASWTTTDVIFSAALLAIIVAVYLYFRG